MLEAQLQRAFRASASSARAEESSVAVPVGELRARASTLYANGRFKEAVRLFSEAIELSPRDPGLYSAR